MDHTGGYYMAIGMLMALCHRQRTGEGQWVDMSCTEAGANLHGADLLDWAVNGRALRADDRPASNRSSSPAMAPHGVFRCAGDDNWIAIACRDDADWNALVSVMADAAPVGDHASLIGRLADQDRIEEAITTWLADRIRWDVERDLQAVGVPASAVRRPAERIDGDLATATRNLWPTVEHAAMGGVRVDGQPAEFSKTPWSITRGAPTLGEHNDQVYGELLGLSATEIDQLRADGVI